MSHEGIQPAGAKMIAEALRTSVNAELTALDMCYNRLGNEGEAVLHQAVQGRSGFELKM